LFFDVGVDEVSIRSTPLETATIPVNAPVALALLLLIVGMTGLGALRRTSV
jgi:hypothetical protein